MRIACMGLLLSLVATVRGEVISRLVDATGADVAEAGLPAEVQAEVARVRKKSTWPAGSSVVVVRAAVPAGAAGDGAIELCRGSSTSSWSVISAREPVRVASFGVTPGAGELVAMPDLKPEAAVWAKLRLGELCGQTGKRAEARPLIQSYLDWASTGQVSREEEYSVPENPWKIAPLRSPGWTSRTASYSRRRPV